MRWWRSMLMRIMMAVVALLLAGGGAAWAAPSLAVYPSEIHLRTARAAHAIVAVLTDDDGVSHDVTDQARMSIVDASVARLEGHVVRPVKDGQTQVRVTLGAQTQTIDVQVKDASADGPLSFKLDVMPVFMNAGCNTGACHGSARGKDGFRLSLFGFDPDGDYYRLTREQSTRRVDLAEPAQSLLLLKATGQVPHTGGKRFAEQSANYATLLRWLNEGAARDGADIARPVAVDLLPRQLVMQADGAHQQLIAHAVYSDGSERDVTGLAVFMSNNDNSATVSPTGLITTSHRGEAFVMARFATFTVGTQVIVIPPGPQGPMPSMPQNNYIDALVNAKLRKLRVVPSPVCGDEQFLRRASIDIVGQLPTPAERERFLSDQDPAKRQKLVEELLSRKEFIEMWVMKWAELLQIRSNDGGGTGISYKAALLYYNWLQDRIARNVPFDQIVRELLMASGGTFHNPATNYYQTQTDTLKLAENTAQVFMGVRTQCAQCHNHPFDRWTMDDYYGFAAFFTQIARKAGEDPREVIVCNSGSGETRHPVGDRVVAPKFLGGPAPDAKSRV